MINNDFSNWMQSLPNEVKQRRINRIALPGTHDSQSYQIDFARPLGPGWPFALANLAARISQRIAGIIRDWTLTQATSVYGQLSEGCRSFDFRVDFDPSNDSFYFTHTFTCIPMDTALNDIARFLESHPGETVIFQMQPGYFDRRSMSSQIGDRAVQKVSEVLGTWLCPATSDYNFDDTMTLEKMVSRNQRILCYYHGKLTKEYSFLWSEQHIDSPWDNTSNLTKKLSDLGRDLEGFKVSEKSLNMISFTLTPQQKDVIQDIFKRFLQRGYKGKGVFSYAQKMHEAIPKFWEQHRVQIRKATVFKTNFPTPEFMQRVISVNLMDLPDQDGIQFP